MPYRARPTDQRGFTLIEVMVAMVILLVGVLGVVTLIDGANAVTSKTKAREGGTSIARSVIEVSRSIRYRDLTDDELRTALSSRPGLADAKPGTTGYTFRSRNIDYELTLTVCSLDDPKDGLGNQPPGAIFCDDTDELETGDTATDRNPDDYKRVRVRLVWSTRGTSQSITQTSSIINPVGGLGPSVVGLTPISGALVVGNQVRVDSEVASASFAAQTSNFAADLSWSVNGDGQGKGNGGPSAWTFTWDFLDSDGNIVYYDCNYFIQADAFDAEGRAGAPRILSVIVNRMAPIAPRNFEGGRNGSGDNVDLRWNPNPECDVAGYEVFRSSDPSSDGTKISCPDPDDASLPYTTETTCVDTSAPESGPLYYRVRALDTTAAGVLRGENFSSQVVVPESGTNNVPTPPVGVSSCIGGQALCVGPDGEAAPTGTVVIRWNPSIDLDGTVVAYRIYRDGDTYLDRHDDFFPDPSGGILAWLEYADPDGEFHEYRVSGVDDDFGESALSEPVSAAP
jgi:prepilin-type N-terminal cleavage/methylation domain-containing protein